MFRTIRAGSEIRPAIRLLTAALLIAAIIVPSLAVSQQPTRKIASGQPVKMAVLAEAVHTPVFVRAYDRFRKQHGTDKLVLDLWIEQEWAESPRALEFDKYDMILALRCSIPGLEKAVAAAADKGTWVVSHSDLKYRDIAVLVDDLPDIAPYYRQRGVSNMVGLLERVCEKFKVPGVKAAPPSPSPIEGIYHPDAGDVFADAESYWKWYSSRPGFKADAPKIGIFVYNTLYLNEETDFFTQLIRTVEEAGANPVLGFWFLPVGEDNTAASPVLRFFAGVDVLMTSSFRLMQEKQRHYEELQKLDVPVLNSIILNIPQEEWQQSRQGLPASTLLSSIVNPELSGLIEPTVIAARQQVTNPETKQRYFRSVVLDENLQWQIRRALAWARLRRTAPADRRVAILYYNHSGGKQNVGASYLNVTASLERILDDLVRRGYRIEGKIDRQAVVDSMRAVGRNVGQWAPGELDLLVEKGAILWPLESYLAYYDRLPEEVRRQISQQWGQPPGDVMTVSRDGRRWFVLPAFQVGNVLLAPQPARASSQKQASLYHDPLTWPTHQYLAFYFWLKHEWQAAAVVHLGRHGTLEFLPGKSCGLGWDDPSSIVLGELPNLYPYIVDGIGEAVAAKRRGQAVILTHATPPLTGSELYGELARLRELTNHYARAHDQQQAGLQAEYYQSILKLAGELGYQPREDCEHIDGQEQSSALGSAEDRAVHLIEHWLADVQSQSGPRGLHTFGEAYSPEATADMLPRMFRDEFQVLRDGGLGAAEEKAWLAAVAGAETPAPPAGDKADARAVIEAAAWHMRHNQELDFLARGLDGRFIPVGPPGDPLSNPDIFPTGRNQYQYNSAKLPTREAWRVGKRMAEETLEIHRRRYGDYPGKLSVTLWANTLIRTHGALEAEILCFLGVEPVWNSRGDLEDVKLITPLGRPRVDVVMTVTGMYRDSFPDKMLLLDKAVRLAADAPAESGMPNHVGLNTERIARELTGKGTKPEESRELALVRIFGAQTGMYGTGVGGLVQSSGRWSQQSEVADQYLQRMSFAYSGGGWSQPARELFAQQLRGVQGVVHGRSSNLYGIMDLTENFEYQGALALAVEQLDGKQPDLYVNDLVQGERVMSGREAVVLELLSRYHNPEFIEAMVSEGYDGAKYFSRIADNQFGWDVVSDAITADDWKKYAEIYLEDKHQLGLREFFDQHNPHALENIASRVLETHRKGLQELDGKTLELAARVYVETIAQHGAACTSHICDGAELNAMAEKLAEASGQLADGALERFRRQLLRTGNVELAKAMAPAGASDLPAAAPQAVEGQVMTPPEPDPGRQTVDSSAPLPPVASAGDDLDPSRPEAASVSAAPRGNRNWLTMAALIVVCALVFVSGMFSRAVRSRPTTRP
ncbi:MAG: cobaltochelatase subunit CobN [Rhodopirellula sp.]|nr:cobaltochelatase subunit CobN [Rhodopirellula sp.]